MGEQMKRMYMNVETVKTIPERGGGTTNVEEKASMSITEMYARMLATGELQTGMHVKSINHGAKERAVALMEAATEAPKYMKEGDVYRTLKKIKTVEEMSKINKQKQKEIMKEKEIEERVNKMTDEKMKEYINNQELISDTNK